MVAVVLLAGCSQVYGPANTGRRLLAGGGYRDTQVDARTWEVEYNSTDVQWSYDMAVYRAAEIAEREGFAYFSTERLDSTLVPVYAGDQYRGQSTFVTVRMQGYHDPAQRCHGGAAGIGRAGCDLRVTAQVLGR